MKNKKDICKKREMRKLCRQFARSGETKESVSNDDGDGNKNGKKAMGLDCRFRTFLCRHCTTTTCIFLFSCFIEDINTQKGFQILFFFHVFMTKSEINTFTFCTNIFGQFSCISIFNYLFKETD